MSTLSKVYCPLCAYEMDQQLDKWACADCGHVVNSPQEALDQLNDILRPQMESWNKLHGVRDV